MFDRRAQDVARGEERPVQQGLRELESEAAARIEWLERELRARGGDATLFHEVGRIWEQERRSPRNAAVAYQNAYRHDRTHVPTLQAARRLFAEVGNWQLVEQLLEAEAEATPAAAERAELIFERGVVVEARLGRPDEARPLFERALEVLPRHLPTLLHLAARAAAGRDPGEMAAACERLAVAVDDPGACARLWATAAAIHEDRRDDSAEAARCWAAAFAADPSDVAVARGHARQLERQGRLDELAEVLHVEAALPGEPGAAACYRLSRLLTAIGREEEALEALLAARERSPGNQLVLQALASIYEARSAWEPLAQVLEAQVERSSDEGERVALLLALGGIYDERLGRREAAIASYRGVLALCRHHGQALASLGRLQHQAADWQGLLGTFEAEAAAADDPRQRATRLYKAAMLLEERLGAPDEAVARHEAILQLLPGYLPSLQALTRLLAARGRWPELVAMLEQDLAAATDRDQQLDTLARIARIEEQGLGDPLAAVATHRRMLAIAPDNLPTIRSLARLAEAAGAWEDLAFALEREAARTPDQRQTIGLLHRVAEIVEERLGDRERAIAAWQHVLTVAPTYLPALRAMGRIYASQERWSELVAMHRREAEATADRAAAAALLCRAAALQEEKLGDPERAAATYREVLVLDPAHFPALQRLARLRRKTGDWAGLVAVLREEAAARTDPGERATVFCQVAEILEERLGKPDAAAEAWQEALRLVPGHRVALQALERLHLRSGAWRRLAEVYERQLGTGDLPGRAGAYVRLGQLYLDRWKEPARAAHCCEAALELEPGDPHGLQLLERVRSQQGDWHRRAAVRARLAAVSRPPALQTALLLAAHADRERVAAPPQLAELAEAVRLARGERRAFEALEGALLAAGDAEGLAEALAEGAEGAAELPMRIARLHRLAHVRARGLRDDDGAIAALRALLALCPGHLPALLDEGRLLEARGDLAALRSNLQERAAALRDPELAAEALVRAASLAEAAGDDEAREADLREALRRHPDHAAAHLELEALLAARGGMEALVELHEARAARASDPREAADALVAAAVVRHEGLGAAGGALALLDEALEMVPDAAAALEAKARILGDEGRWDEAAAALEERLRLGGDPARLAPIRRQLADLLAERIGDPVGAAAQLEALVATAPGDDEAWATIARLRLAAGDLGGARVPLERLLAGATDPALRAALLADLARVHEEGLGDLTAAAGCLERLIEIDPGALPAWERLARLYERMRELASLASTLERWAQREPPARAAALLTRAAAVRAVPLGQRGTALELLREAVARDPSSREARAALAARAAEDPALEAEALAQHRWLVEVEPCRIASWRALATHCAGTDRAHVLEGVVALLGGLEPAERAARRDRLATARHPAALDPGSLLPAAAQTPLAAVARLLAPEVGRALTHERTAAATPLPAAHEWRHRYERSVRILGGDPASCAIHGAPGTRLAIEPSASAVAVALAPSRLLDRAGEGERAFLLGRLAALHVLQTGWLLSLPLAEAAALLGAAVQLHVPHFEGLGPVEPGLVKRLGKALSRRVRKALESAARAVSLEPAPWDAAALVDAVDQAADRVGLLLCGDVEAALTASLLLEDGALRFEDPVARQRGLERSPRGLHLLRWAVDDEHLALRRQLGIAAGAR